MTPTVDLARLAKSPYPPTRLWAFVLLLAVKDKATQVRFAPGQGERALTYTFEGVEYAMVPPPAEMGPSLIEAARRLPCPQGWRTLLARLVGRWKDPMAQTSASFQIGLKGLFTQGSLFVDVPAAPQAVTIRLQPDTAVAERAKELLVSLMKAPPSIADHGDT